MKIVSPIYPSIIKSQALGNRPAIGDTEKFYRVGNTVYVWDDSAQAYVGVASASFFQANYLVTSLSPDLTNERVITPGTNITGTDGGAGAAYTISALIGSLEPLSITVTPGSRQDNYNPTGWNSAYPNRATIMFLNPTTHFVMGGLQGGLQGRVAILINVSEKLIILEHEGTGSSSANRFAFSKSMAYFLMPGRSIYMVYNTTLNKWVSTDQTNGLDVFTDFYQEGAPTSQMESCYWHTQNGGSVNGGSAGSLAGALGSVNISTGTTNVAGNAKMSMIQRSSVVQNGGSKDYYMSLCRIGLDALPTVGATYQASFGMGQNGIGSFSPTAGGAYYAIDISRSATNFYCAAGATPTTAVSGLALATGWLNLGVFNSDFTEACFFYSNDGGTTYVIDQVITTVIPNNTTMNLVGIWSVNAAATAKRLTIDYMGSCYKTVR
jgi:hypothetical protein